MSSAAAEIWLRKTSFLGQTPLIENILSLRQTGKDNIRSMNFELVSYILRLPNQRKVHVKPEDVKPILNVTRASPPVREQQQQKEEKDDGAVGMEKDDGALGGEKDDGAVGGEKDDGAGAGEKGDGAVGGEEEYKITDSQDILFVNIP